MANNNKEAPPSAGGPGPGPTGNDSAQPGTAPHVAPVYLRPLVDEARRTGLAVAPYFRGLGFTASDLDRPGLMLSHQEATTVVRRALRALDNPALGLQLGMRSRITDRGALALGLMASPTLGASIDLTLRYPQSAGFLLDVHTVRMPGRHGLLAESRFDSHDLAPFLVDKLFSGLVRQWRQICEADCSPLLVELMRPPPANLLAHEQHYRCPVRFNGASNRMLFDAKWLKWPLPMANAMSHRLAEQWLAREADSLRGASTIGLAVMRAIGLALPQTPPLAQVASMLNLSERSLRRRLAAEKLSYRTLLDDSRKTRALALMTSGRRSIAEAAAATGFGDARSFRRAFRRWTGDSPTALRNAHQSEAAELEPGRA